MTYREGTSVLVGGVRAEDFHYTGIIGRTLSVERVLVSGSYYLYDKMTGKTWIVKSIDVLPVKGRNQDYTHLLEDNSK